MAKILIILGVVLILIGVFSILVEKTDVFRKVPLGKLPGDIVIKRGSFSFYFPLTTCILISVILTLILWLLRK